MNLIKFNLRSIIILVLVGLGLIVTIYLVRNPQIFKSRADASRLKVSDKDGNPVSWVCENNDTSKCKFTTTSDQITIGVQDQAVQSHLFDRPKNP